MYFIGIMLGEGGSSFELNIFLVSGFIFTVLNVDQSNVFITVNLHLPLHLLYDLIFFYL